MGLAPEIAMIHTFPLPAFLPQRLLAGAARATLVGLLALFSIAASAQVTTASGLDSLEAFVKNTKSGRAVSTQVVTSPAKEGQVVKSKSNMVYPLRLTSSLCAGFVARQINADC